MKDSKRILITGGAGFIGSHVVRNLIETYPEAVIVNLDLLTYAGNVANLTGLEQAPNYQFVQGDIRDEAFINQLFATYQFTHIVHLAAESHVDRSIVDPLAFVTTNVLGTVVLLNAFRQLWEGNWKGKVFYHISTDEVYGTLGTEGLFVESTAYSPNSPYSASKASSDHFVRAYGETYQMPYLISNCSNNYGPNQYPEKLIPLTIQCILHQKPIPVYGTGSNIRDWLYVEDHAQAILFILAHGKLGETYNVGGNNEVTNLEIVQLLCDLLDTALMREAGDSRKLIHFVEDRKGHDFRYAIDASKLQQLGWMPQVTLQEGLHKTIDWYLANQAWIAAIENRRA
ncbi:MULTISPECIES: dTDP-glucose 4,6-dehydratase [unclassified Myroides]|uniref:dTDP-glucose 4,6-dehydratase n=1 Tax=unclassified Myroides TaxID=2642485 RepID=UPI0015F8191C|nr:MULTISPECIES: dTDP-glucose 4,6-dehydratase [unclassified Myroides]MBB1150133.1 dTDP-glucose 4,6-dehydratase [Myroides sp. NP-2]MDM1408366.1 dTDP-glucose 4,6-dehydratase [Myroides sp. DF42-4-2]